MSFGFSTGDFVAGLGLIKQVTDVLNASTSSVTDFTALIGALRSLENAFKICDLIYLQFDEPHIESTARAKAETVRQQLLHIHERSKIILHTFLISINVFTTAFTNSQVKTLAIVHHVRRITWLAHKADIAKLEIDLKGHLNALHICISALCHIYLTSNPKALSSNESKVDIPLSNMTDLLPKVTSIVIHIQNTNRFIPSLGNPRKGGAAQFDIIILHDAIGRDIPFPKMILNSPMDLHQTLSLTYHDQDTPGRHEKLRKKYVITDKDNDGSTMEETSWTTVTQQEKDLSLNMVFDAKSSFAIYRCPICNRPALGATLAGQRRRCVTCQLNFRIYNRERIVEGIEASLPVDAAETNDDPSEDQKIGFEVNLLPPLHRAAATGSIGEMATLVYSGIDIDCELQLHMETEDYEFHGASPLLIAAWFGKIRCIEFLLRNGANLNATDTDKSGILEYAICGPCRGRIMTRLLTLGANPHTRNCNGETLLHLASQRGLFWAVDLLIDLGAELNAKCDEGVTPIHYAALNGHTETARTLIDLGADSSIYSNGDKWTPLHAASSQGDETVVALLLENYTNIEVVDSYGNRPLHIAVLNSHPQVVGLLLALGADVMVRNCEKMTALHYAARVGETSIVELLLDYDADSSAINVAEENPLHEAARNGHYGVVKLLLEYGADIQAMNYRGMTALHVALANRRKDVAMLLLSIVGSNKPDRHGFTCLHWAAISGLDTLVKDLLLNGADIDVVPTVSDDPSWVDGTALILASARGQSDAVRVLLELGADVNAICRSNQESALHKAAKFGYANIIKLLVDHGAKIESRDCNGNTPLLRAAAKGIEPTKVLLEAGAEIEVVNLMNETPVFRAVASNTGTELIKLLLKYGCKPSLQDRTESAPWDYEGVELPTSEALELLIASSLDVNKGYYRGRTALFTAIMDGNEDAAKCLLKHGCELLLQDRSDAAPWDYKRIALPAIEVLDLLIASGLDVNKRYYQGRTALYTAVRDGNNNAIKFLLEHNCELLLQDQTESAPWDYEGVVFPDIEVLDLLISSGLDINRGYHRGRTALHTAIIIRDEVTVRFLLTHGCRISLQDDDGYAPWDKPGRSLPTTNILDLLITYGWDIDEQYYDGQSIFHTAVHAGEEELARYLIGRGCNVDTKAYDGSRPMSIAIAKENISIQALIREAREAEALLALAREMPDLKVNNPF